MKNNKHPFTRLLLLVFIIVCVLIGTVMPAAAVMVRKPLEDKTISILGDSISTFENISCADAALTSNSTIKDNRLFYTDGRLGVGLKDTWWMQITEELGGKILVNNSCSNSTVFDPTGADSSQAYMDRCLNLHDDTGENSGEEPDIIIVYIGINDFSYNKDCLGTFTEIDFSSLITETEDSVFYADPTTTCEAYAIMLHKIITRYKDSEVYCFNFPLKNNMSAENYERFKQYNESIVMLCDKFGCNIVDLFSVIDLKDSSESHMCYYDGVHPNKNGMDFITNAFIDSFYNNSRYSDFSTESYEVEYQLNDVIVSNGKRYRINEGEDYYCHIISTDGAPVKINVYIDGSDCTDRYVTKNKVYIPEVSGNIIISSHRIADNSPAYYFFSTNNDGWQNIINNEFSLNDIKVLSGEIHESVLSEFFIEFSNTICLMSSESWNLVWRASYQTQNNDSVFSFNNYPSDNEEGNQFIKLDTSKKILTIGYYSNGKTYSYGIDLNKTDIDFEEFHTYRLSNSPTENCVNLYIDGKKIDTLSSHYIDGELQKKPSSKIEIKDVYINHFGSLESPVSNSSIDYIKIWESDFPETHIHSYEYSCTYELTCTEDERVESTCDCGDSIKETTKFATGHKESIWLTSTAATVHSSGTAYTVCENCGTLLNTKILPQLKPSAPKIYSISNKAEGIKIDWYSVNGADSYRVYRRGAGEGYWTYLGTVTNTSYLDTTAKNNAYWRYTVRAGNEAGYGTYDNNGKYIKYVSVPHIQKIENRTDGILISWNKIYGATSYRVYRNRLGYSNWTYVGTTTSTTYLDKTIKRADGVYYKYTIRAVNLYYSDYETDTQYIKRLSTPVLIHAKNYSYGVEIKWKPVLGTTGYYVYRKTDKSGWVCLGSVGGTNNTVYFDRTAVKGVKYTYTVKACYGKFLSSYNTKGVSNKK